MTIKRILLIQGHPDTVHPRLCHALTDAYAAGAYEADHLIRTIHVAELDFPLLRSQQDREAGPLTTGLQQAQDGVQRDGVRCSFLYLLTGRHASAAQRFSGAGSATGLRIQTRGQQNVVCQQGTDRPSCSGRGHHEHASTSSPLVFPCPQHQVTRTQYSGLRRDKAGQWNAERHGDPSERDRRQHMIE